MAGDVYGGTAHAGRGGWTWYTGSAGWMYRAGIEWVLGVTKSGDTLSIDPCIPRDWPGFTLRYRHGRTFYHVVVENPSAVMRGVAQVELDGERQPAGRTIALVDDGGTHQVRVVLG
jgi:cyclic beta-1,2-glucan synthetase